MRKNIRERTQTWTIWWTNIDLDRLSLSLYLSIYPTIYLSIYLSISLSLSFTTLCFLSISQTLFSFKSLYLSYDKSRKVVWRHFNKPCSERPGLKIKHKMPPFAVTMQLFCGRLPWSWITKSKKHFHWRGFCGRAFLWKEFWGKNSPWNICVLCTEPIFCLVILLA